MKLFPCLVFLAALAALAQTAPPKPAGPPPAPAQTAPPKPVGPPPAPANLPPETVIASYQNEKLTYGELQKFMGILPPQTQQQALRDRKSFVKQYFLMKHLAQMAEQAKLDQQSPTKEALAYNRLYVLMGAQLNQVANTIEVSDADLEKFYESNKDRFTQVKLKVIYVSFSSNPSAQPASQGKKILSESEAKAKIEKILAEIRAGADFVKMVKENSEDQTSAAKDGDFGVIRKSDNVPDAIRVVVFALKPGQVSEPVRQPNGFYLFRAESVAARSFKEVREEIYTEARQVKYKEWLDHLNKSLEVKFENESFFGNPPAAPAK